MQTWKSKNQRLLGSLLTPSWTSGLLVLLIGLIIAAGTIISFRLDTSGLEQQLLAWQQHQSTHPLTTPDQFVPDPQPTLHDSWPLLLVWSGVGLVVYALAINIVQTISSAKKLRQSMDYVNARPQAMLHAAVEHLILRSLAALMVIGLAWLLLHQTLAYSITAGHAAAIDLISPNGLLYTFLSFAMVAVNLHLIIIFTRLAAARPRVFS